MATIQLRYCSPEKRSHFVYLTKCVSSCGIAIHNKFSNCLSKQKFIGNCINTAWNGLCYYALGFVHLSMCAVACIWSAVDGPVVYVITQDPNQRLGHVSICCCCPLLPTFSSQFTIWLLPPAALFSALQQPINLPSFIFQLLNTNGAKSSLPINNLFNRSKYITFHKTDGTKRIRANKKCACTNRGLSILEYIYMLPKRTQRVKS